MIQEHLTEQNLLRRAVLEDAELGKTPELDEETLHELKALGYIGD